MYPFGLSFYHLAFVNLRTFPRYVYLRLFCIFLLGTQNPCALNGGCTQLCSAKDGHPVCSCLPGYTLIQNYRCINSNSSCQSSYFTCTSGKCVPQLAVCDSVDDCIDGSDELPLVCGTCLNKIICILHAL